VQDLARIAASSKHLREACVAIARRDFLKLLRAAVTQAAEAEAELRAAEAAAEEAANREPYVPVDFDLPSRDAACQLQVHAVAWLLRAAPAEAAADAAVECVLCIHAVPKQAAVQLLTAGMRVSSPQLLRAANRMVKGVGVWALAQQQLGVQTDISAAAVDICSGEVSVFTCWVSFQRCIRSPLHLCCYLWGLLSETAGIAA
jgi:hypothetical protein